MLEAQLQAVADPTRREILKLTADRPLSAGDIAARFKMSRPAVSQHLKVLREAGLIRMRAEGTSRLYLTNRGVLLSLFEQLDDYWSLGLLKVKQAAENRAREIPAGERSGRGRKAK
jgi:DNA-binding transcriptional ArsR family regulator